MAVVARSAGPMRVALSNYGEISNSSALSFEKLRYPLTSDEIDMARFDPLIVSRFLASGVHEGYTLQEFAVAGWMEALGGKMLADIDVRIRIGGRNKRFFVDSQDRHWFDRLRHDIAKSQERAELYTSIKIFLENREIVGSPIDLDVLSEQPPYSLSVRIDHNGRAASAPPPSKPTYAIPYTDVEVKQKSVIDAHHDQSEERSSDFRSAEALIAEAGSNPKCKAEVDRAVRELIERLSKVLSGVPQTIASMAERDFDSVHSRVLEHVVDESKYGGSSNYRAFWGAARATDIGAASTDIAREIAASLCKIDDGVPDDAKSHEVAEMYRKGLIGCSVWDKLKGKFRRWLRRRPHRLPCPNPNSNVASSTYCDESLYLVCAPIGAPAVDAVQNQLLESSMKCPYGGASAIASIGKKHDARNWCRTSDEMGKKKKNKTTKKGKKKDKKKKKRGDCSCKSGECRCASSDGESGDCDSSTSSSSDEEPTAESLTCSRHKKHYRRKVRKYHRSSVLENHEHPHALQPNSTVHRQAVLPPISDTVDIDAPLSGAASNAGSPVPCKPIECKHSHSSRHRAQKSPSVSIIAMPSDRIASIGSDASEAPYSLVPISAALSASQLKTIECSCGDPHAAPIGSQLEAPPETAAASSPISDANPAAASAPISGSPATRFRFYDADTGNARSIKFEIPNQSHVELSIGGEGDGRSACACATLPSSQFVRFSSPSGSFSEGGFEAAPGEARSVIVAPGLIGRPYVTGNEHTSMPDIGRSNVRVINLLPDTTRVSARFLLVIGSAEKEALRVADLQPRGESAFSGVVAGKYRVEISSPDGRIVRKDLTLLQRNNNNIIVTTKPGGASGSNDIEIRQSVVDRFEEEKLRLASDFFSDAAVSNKMASFSGVVFAPGNGALKRSESLPLSASALDDYFIAGSDPIRMLQKRSTAAPVSNTDSNNELISDTPSGRRYIRDDHSSKVWSASKGDYLTILATTKVPRRNVIAVIFDGTANDVEKRN